MSEIVKNELDAIKAFEDNTEKRRSELTLNELNYISDKQLHKKDSGGTGGGVLVCNATLMEGNRVQLDKTVSEILDAFPNAIMKWDNDPFYNLTAISEFIFDDEVGYQIFFGANNMFTAQNLNDYPTHG